MKSIAGPWFWVWFNVFILAMLAIDLLVFNRKAHRPKMRESIAWSAVWIGVSLLFNLGLYVFEGPGVALEFFTGYLLEKSLSVDNLFVFLLIFSYFKVPLEDQHRVLFWGVLGAIVTRASFILMGAALLDAFDFMFYVFGGFLVFTAARMAFGKEDEEIHPENNPVLRLFRRVMPMTREFERHHFFVRRAGKLYATPMLAVLLMIETSDIVFAVDSIPAVFGVTRDTFVVYSSNIFAILGLRALYFVIAGFLDMLRYLKQGLALVLGFIGVKMLLADFVHISNLVSLLVIAVVLAVATTASILADRRDRATEEARDAAPPER